MATIHTAAALDHISVIDLSEYLSGPYCTKLMSAFGAEVIKVETPGTGDRSRHIRFSPQTPADPERSPVFQYLNTSKKSITLNFHTREGKEILLELLKHADVLVENDRPGVMDQSGLGYAILEKLNPGLVMASITDFGQTGVYRDYTGGRLAGYALGGYMYVTGDPDREPLAGGGRQPAYQGGLQACIGILAALMNRGATGRGDYVDVSIMECMAGIHQYTLSRYAYSGSIQKRTGNRHMWAHPVTVYPCLDGYVAVSAVTDDQFERLCLAMEMPELASNTAFDTSRKRAANAYAFDKTVLGWFASRSSKDIIEAFMEWRVPAARVNTLEDLLSDPQYRERGFWKTVFHPKAGRLTVPGAPFIMSRTPAKTGRAPLLGEHNRDIYTGRLKMTENRLLKLKEKGVI
ncbi:MAG: CoA transferase [Desulfobacterales bacterium]